MNQAQRQFKQIIRTFMIRALQTCKEKGLPGQADQIQQTFTKIFSSQDLQEVIISKIVNLDLKNDYNQILLLAFLQQLGKWAIEYHQILMNRPIILETFISNSLTLIQSQQQLHTIVSRQNQLICILLTMPYTIQNLQFFKQLYRRLQDVKQYYPGTVRDQQKMLFARCIEDTVGVIGVIKCQRTLQYIHNSVCCEVQVLQETSQLLPSRIKILKKIIKVLWTTQTEIMYRTAYLIAKLSKNILNYPYLFTHLINLYENTIEVFLGKDSLIPLILFEHVITNNLNIAQSKGQYLFIQLLLNQLPSIFKGRYLKYFLRLYDWNFMAEGLCQKIIHLVFSFTQDRSNEKKIQYQLYKRCIKKITENVQAFLDQIPSTAQDKQKETFYELKKKQYEQIVNDMNKHPKRVFKKLDALQPQIKQHTIDKYVNILRRSSHLDKKAMIGILGADNDTSRQLLWAYLHNLMGCYQYTDMEQFLRIFISNFFLNGQAQQIQRTLDQLTQFYYKNQSGDNVLIKDSNSAYVFAHAIVILNTDLHNPKHQNKMTQQTFLKMCKKINAGQDLPQELLKKIFKNVHKYQIHSFRDMNHMHYISYSNWFMITKNQTLSKLSYYDQQMAVLEEQGNFQIYARKLLENIINQKEDAKLEILIERFEYNDKNFQCQIIENLRKSWARRKDIVPHTLEKIYKFANFRNNKITDKVMSYYWLSVNIIQLYNKCINPKKICQLLVLTWKIRMQLNDHLYSRQKIQIKKIKLCLRLSQRKAKKSIMDIFSNFLSKEQSDQQPFYPPKLSQKMNYQSFGLTVLEILQHKINIKQAIQYLIAYLRNQQSKIFEEFLSLLTFIFYLVISYQMNQQCEELFEELLGLKDSQICTRISSLKTKDPKKYLLLTNYSKFQILKIIIKNECKNHDLIREACHFFEIIDKNLLTQVLHEAKNQSSLNERIVQQIQNKLKVFGKIEQSQWFFIKYDLPQQKKQSKKDITSAKTINQTNQIKPLLENKNNKVQNIENEQPQQKTVLLNNNTKLEQLQKPDDKVQIQNQCQKIDVQESQDCNEKIVEQKSSNLAKQIKQQLLPENKQKQQEQDKQLNQINKQVEIIQEIKSLSEKKIETNNNQQQPSLKCQSPSRKQIENKENEIQKTKKQIQQKKNQQKIEIYDEITQQNGQMGLPLYML